jgi:hypothetical protein
MSSQYALLRWWQGDRRIVYVFALYGLAAGIVTFIAGEYYYNDQLIRTASFASNYPAIVAMLFFFAGTTSPVPSFVLIISTSIIAWSFIGLLLYSFVKMFKMGP